MKSMKKNDHLPVSGKKLFPLESKRALVGEAIIALQKLLEIYQEEDSPSTPTPPAYFTARKILGELYELKNSPSSLL